MQTIDEALEKLSKSKFRSSFHLKEKDIEYINKVGMQRTLSKQDLHQNIFPMTESKHQ